MSDSSTLTRGTRRGAFTLIELLVVVAIIAVLAAMLMPALGKSRTRALRTQCLNNQKQIMLAANLYADERDGFIPPGFDGGLGPNGRAAQDEVFHVGNGYGNDGYWGQGLLVYYGYLGDVSLMYCPNRMGDKYGGDMNEAKYGVKKFGVSNTMSAYLHRNDNPFSGLAYNARIAEFGSKAWSVDKGMFYKIHTGFPTAYYFWRWYNHEDGFNVGYLDGSARFFQDPSQTLYSNVDGGPAAYAAFDRAY